MFARLKQAVATLEQAVAGLDPDVLEPSFALDLVKLFSKVEKLAAAGKTLAAERVASSGSWKAEGDRSPAHFLARMTGDSVGATVTAIETARRMSELPKAGDAFRSGELTPAAAAEIASAASLAPDKETELLKVAENEGILGLRQECRRVVASSCQDEAEKAERLHKGRYLRSWTDPEGAFRLDGSLAPEAGAEVRVALNLLREELFEQARRQGIKEPYQAMEADALVEMARSYRSGKDTSGPKAMVNVRVDHAALVRGHTNNGEVCEIPGVGPISVAAARALASDSILKVLLVKGTEVKTVAHYGRTIPAALRTAVIETYPECVVQGCHEIKRLETDHVIPLPEGPTAYENLVRICGHHHRLKTHHGFVLGPRRDGKARLDPPKGSRSRASPKPKE